MIYEASQINLSLPKSTTVRFPWKIFMPIFHKKQCFHFCTWKAPRSFKSVSQLTYKPRDKVVKLFPSFLYNTSTLVSYIFSNTCHHMKSSFLCVLVTISLHKKWSFPLRMSSVNHQIRRFLRTWSTLLNKPLMGNFIFCAVFAERPFVSSDTTTNYLKPCADCAFLQHFHTRKSDETLRYFPQCMTIDMIMITR